MKSSGGPIRLSGSLLLIAAIAFGFIQLRNSPEDDTRRSSKKVHQSHHGNTTVHKSSQANSLHAGMVNTGTLLERLKTGNPSSQLHALGMIDEHDLWSALIEAVPNDPSLAPVLAEAAAMVEPDVASALLWNAIKHGKQELTPSLEDAFSCMSDDALFILLSLYPYGNLKGNQAELLDCAIAGAGSTTLRKLVTDAASLDIETADSALRLLGMVRNPSAWNDVLEIAKSSRPDIAEAAQKSIEKMECRGDTIDYAKNGPDNDVAGFIRIPSPDQSYQEKSGGD